jgi:hypothetical protein
MGTHGVPGCKELSLACFVTAALVPPSTFPFVKEVGTWDWT